MAIFRISCIVSIWWCKHEPSGCLLHGLTCGHTCAWVTNVLRYVYFHCIICLLRNKWHSQVDAVVNERGKQGRHAATSIFCYQIEHPGIMLHFLSCWLIYILSRIFLLNAFGINCQMDKSCPRQIYWVINKY